jgi:beta-lactam-binding protein with PASTA domain
MNAKRAGRVLVWVAGGVSALAIVGLGSFCVALRSERRADVIVVPDWTGVSRENALAEAARLSLVLEVGEQRHDPAVAPDRIVQQEPAPGTQVRHGRTIRVVVSLGGETLTVPAVVGQPARQAELELRRTGLTPGWDARVSDARTPAGQVLDQAPGGGTLSVSGDRVHRLVSEGARAPQWVMPDLTGKTLQDAQEWITLCGFRSGAVRRVPAEGRSPGTIVGQMPLSGYPVGRRDVIELTVAN